MSFIRSTLLAAGRVFNTIAPNLREEDGLMDQLTGPQPMRKEAADTARFAQPTIKVTPLVSPAVVVEPIGPPVIVAEPVKSVFSPRLTSCYKDDERRTAYRDLEATADEGKVIDDSMKRIEATCHGPVESLNLNSLVAIMSDGSAKQLEVTDPGIKELREFFVKQAEKEKRPLPRWCSDHNDRSRGASTEESCMLSRSSERIELLQSKNNEEPEAILEEKEFEDLFGSGDTVRRHMRRAALFGQFTNWLEKQIPVLVRDANERLPAVSTKPKDKQSVENEIAALQRLQDRLGALNKYALNFALLIGDPNDTPEMIEGKFKALVKVIERQKAPLKLGFTTLLPSVITKVKELAGKIIPYFRKEPEKAFGSEELLAFGIAMLAVTDPAKYVQLCQKLHIDPDHVPPEAAFVRFIQDLEDASLDAAAIAERFLASDHLKKIQGLPDALKPWIQEFAQRAQEAPSPRVAGSPKAQLEAHKELFAPIFSAP